MGVADLAEVDGHDVNSISLTSWYPQVIVRGQREILESVVLVLREEDGLSGGYVPISSSVFKDLNF